MADQKIIRKFSAETKALADSRSLIVTISTDSPDRDGDVVVPKGGDFSHFLKNPVVLFGHKYNEPPIAKAEELIADDHAIKAKVTFPEEGVYAFADTIYNLIKAGIMNAWSIGFQSKGESADRLPGGGLQFNAWELLEFSAVPVPANPEALTILRSKGLDETAIKEVTEEAPVALADLPLTLTNLIFAEDFDTVKAFFSDGKDYDCPITPKLQQELRAQSEIIQKARATEEVPSAADISETLKALRDALKPADKQIGLVLRDLKTLLAESKS